MRDWIEMRSEEVLRGDFTRRDGAKTNQYKVRDVQPYAFVRDALDCPWCCSMWCAIFIALARRLPGGRLLRNVLAIAAFAGVADYIDDHLTGVVHDVEHDEPVGTAQTE